LPGSNTPQKLTNRRVPSAKTPALDASTLGAIPVERPPDKSLIDMKKALSIDVSICELRDPAVTMISATGITGRMR
jgi:hypothetical protein